MKGGKIQPGCVQHSTSHECNCIFSRICRSIKHIQQTLWSFKPHTSTFILPFFLLPLINHLLKLQANVFKLTNCNKTICLVLKFDTGTHKPLLPKPCLSWYKPHGFQVEALYTHYRIENYILREWHPLQVKKKKGCKKIYHQCQTSHNLKTFACWSPSHLQEKIKLKCLVLASQSSTR